MRSPLSLVPWLVLAVACAPSADEVDDTEDTDDTDVVDDTEVPDDTADDTDDTDDTGLPPLSGCRAVARPADAERAVVVSLPYDSEGRKATTWEVLTLDADGELTRPGRVFTMGRATTGEVAFTPDGSLGLVAQEDGSLGVFTLDDEGVPTVVDLGWADGFYASAVSIDSTGERAWVVDGNWPENGGGLYELRLDCETGEPTLVGRTVRTKLASALHLQPYGRVVVVADALAAESEGDVFVVDTWPLDPEIRGGAVLFPDGEAIAGGSAVTADGRHVLVGDTSAFSETPNRVAWASLDAGAPVAGGALDLLDPYAIVASPFDDAALVASGFGDAFVVLGYDANADPAFTDLGEPAYVGADPALPGSMVVVRRGELAGLVLAIENVAVRRLRFDGEGGVEDLGPFGLGEGLDAIPGAIGVQP